MALIEDDSDLDEEGSAVVTPPTPAPTTTAAPTAPATPGGSGRTPTPVTSSVLGTSPLEQVMSAHNESWAGRMRNIGAGGSAMTGITKDIPGGPLGNFKLRAIGTGIASTLSGGFLGSYSLNAEGSIQKALDAITEQRTEIDYNSTVRISNIWRSADKRIHSLSTKIRLCEEIEQSIDDQIAINEGFASAAIDVKKAPPGATKAAATEVAAMWKKIKPFKSHIGVGVGSFSTIAVLGCPPLAAAALCGMLPIGIAVAIRRAKSAPFYDESDTKKLTQARALVSTIRKDAELKRDEYTGKLEKEYPQEKKNQEELRGFFTKDVAGIVSKKEATMLLDEYESLVMRPPVNPEKAIKDLIDTMTAMKRADNTSAAAFSKVDLGKTKTSLTKLLSQRAIDFRQKVNESIGLLKATGPEQMTALIRRICQVHAISPQTGRIVQLSIGASGENKMFRIVAIDKVDINLEEVTVANDLADPDKINVTTVRGNPVSIHLNKKTMRLERQIYKISTEDLKAEIASKTEADLKGGTPEEMARQKKLLADAKDRRLSVVEYKELWAALKPPTPNYAQNGLPFISEIANNPSNTFEQKKVPKVPDADLMAEIASKTEADLKAGTAAEIARWKQLLADGKTRRLTVAEYKELWAALKSPPANYAENGLPFISQIANNPSDTFEQVPGFKQSTTGIIAEIRTKNESDLVGGTATEIARQKQLLAAAKIKRLTVAEYKELWEALRPPADYAQNGLPSVYEVINNPGNAFEQELVDIQPTEGLMAEIKVKTDNDLAAGTPMEMARHKQLLARAKTSRLSVAEYKELWNALKPEPYVARHGLRLMKQIAENPSDTFEQILVDKVSTEDLMAEIRTKTESDFIGGTSSEIARQKKLLADGKTRRLTVAEYRELWAALKPPAPHYSRKGLTLIEEIVNNPSGTFEMANVDKVPTEDLIAEIKLKKEDDLKGGTPSVEARQKQLLADAKTRRLTVAEYKELWAALKPPNVGKLGLPLIEQIATDPRDTFEQKDVDKISTADLIAEIKLKKEDDLKGGTPSVEARQKQLLADAKTRRLTVAEYRELWAALKPPNGGGQAGLTKIGTIANSTNGPEYIYPAIEDSDTIELK